MRTPVYREFFQNVHNEKTGLDFCMYLKCYIWFVWFCVWTLNMFKLNYLKQLKKKPSNIAGEEKAGLTKWKDIFHDSRLRNEYQKIECSKNFDQILLGTKGKDHNFLRGLDEQGRGLKPSWRVRLPWRRSNSVSHPKLHLLGRDNSSIVTISSIHWLSQSRFYLGWHSY